MKFCILYFVHAYKYRPNEFWLNTHYFSGFFTSFIRREVFRKSYLDFDSATVTRRRAGIWRLISARSLLLDSRS